MSRIPARPGRTPVLLILVALLLWATFPLVAALNEGFPLGLGKHVLLHPLYLSFLTFYCLFALAGVSMLAVGLDALLPERFTWKGLPERPFLVAASLAALLIPVGLRLFVLRGAPLTDDEALYRFSAELLASGRVFAPSHALSEFFNHVYQVNNGRMYAIWFMGWPALMLPGLLVGLEGYVNALLFGLTVPPLYFLAREFMSRPWAQLVVLLLVLSPMLEMSAATMLSHTATFCALTWTALLATRLARHPGRWWTGAGLATAFSVAFFIRPLTAVGIGVPFLLYGLYGLWRGLAGRFRTVLAFSIPALALAALFLTVNGMQTGSIWTPAYVAYREYAAAGDFSFHGLSETSVPNLRIHGAMFTVLAFALIRLNFALFGWPVSFLFVPLAWGRRRAGVLWASLGFFCLVHLPLETGGIDSFGPVHFTELGLPVLLLTGLGVQRAHAWLRARRSEHRSLPLTVLAGLVVASLLLYVPYRFREVARIADMVLAPAEAVEEEGLQNAVVFVSSPNFRFCHPRVSRPPNHFVLWWPVNDPDFRNDIVWANHMSVPRNRTLMTHFPEREARVLHWTQACTVELLTLEEAADAGIPDGPLAHVPPA